VLASVVAACAAREVLAPRDGTVPPGVDLSGNWILRNDQKVSERRLRDAIRKTDGVADERVLRPPSQSDRSGRDSRVRGGLVYVFLETGTALKVTQTPYALFISFDRAVVEEFRFGEDRMVNVGQVEAQRVTGWEGQQLVVETLDRNNMKLTERFQLTAAGSTLERRITLRSKSGDEETLMQLFDRADPR